MISGSPGNGFREDRERFTERQAKNNLETPLGGCRNKKSPGDSSAKKEGELEKPKTTPLKGLKWKGRKFAVRFIQKNRP